VAGSFYNVTKWSDWLRIYGVATIVLLYICKFIMLPFLMIDDLVRLGRWIGSLFSPRAPGDPAFSVSRLKFIVYSGLIVSGILGVNLLYGMFRNAYRYKLHRVKVAIPNLPEAFVGLKIVQISDIHSGSFIRTKPIAEAVEMINGLNPDLILFTGDLVNNLATEIEPFVPIFGKLKARLGSFSVMGNHDYGDYFNWDHIGQKHENLRKLHQAHADMGWKLLLNENAIVEKDGERLAIIGVENWGAKANFPKYGDLQKACVGIDTASVKILLSHDPSHWDAQVRQDRSDIHLTLSGHTHGFQFGIEIPGLKWSPSQYVYDKWAGLYKEGLQYLYVNRGFGFLGYPGRVGILPEITLIELQPA
ncbi:MAG TPA: metallophosphoesterase, partial [Chitinophagales bacterium]|nr:metallophosphoesterase [Chitinophagales bacterium]